MSTESTPLATATQGKTAQALSLFRIGQCSEALVHLVHHGNHLGVIGGCAHAAEQRLAGGEIFRTGVTGLRQAVEIITGRTAWVGAAPPAVALFPLGGLSGRIGQLIHRLGEARHYNGIGGLVFAHRAHGLLADACACTFVEIRVGINLLIDLHDVALEKPAKIVIRLPMQPAILIDQHGSGKVHEAVVVVFQQQTPKQVHAACVHAHARVQRRLGEHGLGGGEHFFHVFVAGYPPEVSVEMNNLRATESVFQLAYQNRLGAVAADALHHVKHAHAHCGSLVHRHAHSAAGLGHSLLRSSVAAASHGSKKLTYGLTIPASETPRPTARPAAATGSLLSFCSQGQHAHGCYCNIKFFHFLSFLF